MSPDTPVALTSTLIALCLLPLGWLVTAGLIAVAGLIGCGCVAFAVWRGRMR